MGVDPAQCSISANDPVFKIKWRLGLDRSCDDPENGGPVFLGYVVLDPRRAGTFHVRQQAATVQLVHFGPVGAHPVDDLRACFDQ